MNAIETIMAVAAIGGRLGTDGDRLKTFLPVDCPSELKAAIREQKSNLIALLNLNFLIVESETVGATLFWVPDESTKNSLLSAGVSTSLIYTARELQLLTGKRITTHDLEVIHSAKETLKGQVRS